MDDGKNKFAHIRGKEQCKEFKILASVACFVHHATEEFFFAVGDALWVLDFCIYRSTIYIVQFNHVTKETE